MTCTNFFSLDKKWCMVLTIRLRSSIQQLLYHIVFQDCFMTPGCGTAGSSCPPIFFPFSFSFLSVFVTPK